MSTIYEVESVINQAVADRSRIPAMIDAAMREHKRAPTAQGALSLARTLSGFMVLTGSTGTATALLVKALLAEAATLGATAADVFNVMQSAERQVHRLIHGEETESDRICDHELAYANLRQACVVAGLDPDEVERKHAEWIRDGGRVAGKE